MSSVRGFRFEVLPDLRGVMHSVRHDTRVKSFIPGRRYLLQAPPSFNPRRWVTGTFVCEDGEMACFRDLLGDPDSILLLQPREDGLYPFRSSSLLADVHFVETSF